MFKISHFLQSSTTIPLISHSMLPLNPLQACFQTKSIATVYPVAMHPDLSAPNAKGARTRQKHPILPKTQCPPNSIFSESIENAQKHTHSEPSTKPSLLTPREKAAVTLATVVFYSHVEQKNVHLQLKWREETKVEVKSRIRRFRDSF